MEEFKLILKEGIEHTFDEYYDKNRKHIGRLIYELIEDKYLYPSIFNTKNIGFIAYLIEKDDLFSLLLSKNCGILFRSTSYEDMMHIFSQYPSIYNIVVKRPKKLLKDKLIEATSEDELVKYLNIGMEYNGWCDFFYLIPELTYDLYVKYSNIFSKDVIRISNNSIINCKDIRLFNEYLTYIDNQHKSRLLYKLLIRNDEEKLRSLLTCYRPNLMNYILTYNNMQHYVLDMIRILYSHSRPEKHIFTATLENSIKGGRLDIFDYIISIAPYDVLISDVLCKYGTLDMIKTYITNMNISTRYNLLYELWSNVVKYDKQDIAHWLYDNGYYENIRLENVGHRNKTYKFLMDKDEKRHVCKIM